MLQHVPGGGCQPYGAWMQVTVQLNALLRAAHGCGLVLRDISLRNVVFAQLPAQHGWTLLDLSSTLKAGKRAHTYSAESLPPEVRTASSCWQTNLGDLKMMYTEHSCCARKWLPSGMQAAQPSRQRHSLVCSGLTLWTRLVLCQAGRRAPCLNLVPLRRRRQLRGTAKM